MLIHVSGSAGRCQGEREAVNKEITYIHRVTAAVCQVAFEKKGAEGKKRRWQQTALGEGPLSMDQLFKDISFSLRSESSTPDTAVTGQSGKPDVVVWSWGLRREPGDWGLLCVTHDK